MKLIYANATCSLSVHILLEEMGLPYEKEVVSLKDKTILDSYNSKSYVPVLVLDDGEILTEAICILQYIVEKERDYSLLAEPGTLERARCLEWLTYVSTELHKGMGPLFHLKDLTPKFKEDLLVKLEKRLQFMDDHLAENTYLVGEDLSIADMYAVAILRIAVHVKLPLFKFKNISRYKIMLENIASFHKAIEDEEGPTALTPKPTEKDMASMGLS
jgi:glutathione S-transferase